MYVPNLVRVVGMMWWQEGGRGRRRWRRMVQLHVWLCMWVVQVVMVAGRCLENLALRLRWRRAFRRAPVHHNPVVVGLTLEMVVVMVVVHEVTVLIVTAV